MDEDNERLLDEMIRIVVGEKMINPLPALRDLKRDALRYRWARERGAWDTESYLNSLTAEEYDAALDKRMAEEP